MLKLLAVLFLLGLSQQTTGLLLDPNDGADAATGTPVIQNCSDTPSEVVFVLDSSGSVGVQNFTVMKNFVKSVIQQLNIGTDKTHVGVITYNRYPVMRIHLTDYMTAGGLETAIDNIPYISGITETDAALDLLSVEGFNGARAGIPRVGIVITDGKSFHPNATAKAALNAQNKGINLFAVGIGTVVNLAELSIIATDPDVQHLFRVETFNSLQNIVQQLSLRTCSVKYVQTSPSATPHTIPVAPAYINSTQNATGACNETLADILFLLDTSGSLGSSNFDLIKQFVMNIINDLDIGANLTKVGVITFSNYPIKRITLGQYPSKLDLLNAVNVIPYYPGSTQTDAALDLARYEGYIGDRANAPNIAIVVTDGHSANPTATSAAAQSLKHSGVNVFAVGIGAEIDNTELETISSSPNSEFVFFVANFTDLSSIEKKLARSTCEVPLQQPTPTTTVPAPVSTTPEPCVAKIADMVFVIDSSGSVGQTNFETIKRFIKQSIDVFDISSKYTRVGVITFNVAATVQFGLDVYNTSASVKNAVDNIVFSSGGTNTGLALETLRLTGFKKERPGVPNIAIIITDGLSSDPIATKVQARLLKEQGDILIAIGVGNETNGAELKNIASVDNRTGHSLVYEVGSFEALKELNSTVPYVACTAVAVTQPPPVIVSTMSPVTAGPPQTTHACMDDIDNCADYGKGVCSDYKPWSMAHCAATCGFCSGAVTTAAPPCVDTIPNCHEYGQYICTTVSVIGWTKTHCPLSCGFCTPQTAGPGGSESSTTMPAQNSIATGTHAGATQASVSPTKPQTQGGSKTTFASPPPPQSKATALLTHVNTGTVSPVTDKPGTASTVHPSSTKTTGEQTGKTGIETGGTTSKVNVTPSPPGVQTTGVQVQISTGVTSSLQTETPSPPRTTATPQPDSTITSATPSSPASITTGVQTQTSSGTHIAVTGTPAITGTEPTSPQESSTQAKPTPSSAKPTDIKTQSFEITKSTTTAIPVTLTSLSPSPPASKATGMHTNSIANTNQPPSSVGTETQSVVSSVSTNGPVTVVNSTTPSPPQSSSAGVQTNPAITPSVNPTGISTQSVVGTNSVSTSGPVTVVNSATPSSSQGSLTGSHTNPVVTPVLPSTATEATPAPQSAQTSASAATIKPIVTGVAVVSTGPTASPPTVHPSGGSQTPTLGGHVTPSVGTTKTSPNTPVSPSVTVGPVATATSANVPNTNGPKTVTTSIAGPVGTSQETSRIPGTSTTLTPTQACASKTADIVFVIDSSGSVGQINFETMKTFMKQTTSVFNIGPDNTKIAVITYNTVAQLQFGLNAYNSSTGVLSAIDAIRFSAGGTDTGAALEKLRKSGFNNERPGVTNIAIVITDGLSSDPVGTRQQARLAKESGNIVIAIGVGNQVDKAELKDIASVDKASNASLVYEVKSFGDLQTVENAMIRIACGAAAGTNPPPMSVTTPEPSSNQTVSACHDTVTNCADYGRGVCFDYKPWAKAHCGSFCGFCHPTGSVATTAHPCKDNIDNCYEYGTYICTSIELIGWTKRNCYKYCGLCEGGSVPTEPPATPAPTVDTTCRNKLPNCNEYGGKSVCTNTQYRSWAKEHCSEYCGFCINYEIKTGITLPSNKTCPAWRLPKECTLVQEDPTCCPLPKCPEGYVLTVKTPLQD